MRNVSFLGIRSCVLGLLLAVPAVADDGFRLPSFNPFKRAEAPVAEPAPVVEESSTARKPFRFPKLPSPPSLPTPKLPKLPTLTLPKFELPAGRSNRPSGTPSSWTRFNQGTKDFFAKTKSALMPWSEKAPERPSPAAGARVASRPKRPTLIPSLFGSTPPEPKVESVNDYLALPRPTP